MLLRNQPRLGPRWRRRAPDSVDPPDSRWLVASCSKRDSGGGTGVESDSTGERVSCAAGCRDTAAWRSLHAETINIPIRYLDHRVLRHVLSSGIFKMSSRRAYAYVSAAAVWQITHAHIHAP
jgi:hypothetical protein